MDKMKPCLMTLIVLSTVFSGTGTINATITVIPSVTVALSNDSTFFNCSTTSVEVEWLFGSNQYPQPIIYSYGTVKPLYEDRFRVEKYANSFGNQFNLILQSVAKDDAGQYICRDPDSPNEEGQEVHLTVLETEPVCESNMNVDAPSSCALQQETVQLSCSVRYTSNQVPELQWVNTGENIAINYSSKCSDSGNTYTCNLTMESELQSNFSYVCQTTKSVTRQYNCTSYVFRVMPVLSEHLELTKTVSDKVNCSVNSNSQGCTLSWIFDNGTTNWIESHERVIEFKRPGRFICQASCTIRNKNCTFATMTVNVIVHAEPQGQGVTGYDSPPIVKIVVGILVAVIASCVIAFILWMVIRRCENRKPRQRSVSEDIVLKKITPMESGNHNKKVRGLTILDGELFAAFKDSNIIEVFPIDFNASHRKLTIDELKCPGTMAACAKNSCLYVIDQIESADKKIFRIKPDGELITTWKTDEDERGRISVNRDGNIVMSVYDKHKLKIYSPNGTLLKDKTIEFSGATIAYISHTINLADGSFILGHGIYKSDIHQVCKIDVKGKVLQSFGNKKGSGDGQLDTPIFLAERNDGSILVTDQNNHRIILLNSELKFVKELFTKENYNFNLPDAMFVYEKTEHALLFLGCNETDTSGGYVLVLRLDE